MTLGSNLQSKITFRFPPYIDRFRTACKPHLGGFKWKILRVDDTSEPEGFDLEIADETPTGRVDDALNSLLLLGDDVFLRMQAMNLAIVNQWLTQLELS